MRKTLPVVVVGGVAIFVASQFFDFGLGFRGGDEAVVSTSNDSSNTLIEAIVNDEATEAVEDNAAIEEPMSEPPALEIVDVQIDGNQYLVVTDANNPEARSVMSLDEISQLAAAVPGEPSGIKVRIARTPAALASAEAALLKRLEQAALSIDQIDQRRQLVE